MRARHGLGLVFVRQGKYTEAIREFEELLRRNPNDNQGVRYLIGGAHHLAGNVRKAIDWYVNAGSHPMGSRDPENEFNRGLALYQLRRYKPAVFQFRVAFFLNLYLPQVVLFRSVRPLRIWHGSNWAEPQHALDYWEIYSKLWLRRRKASVFLRLVYQDKDVQRDLKSIVSTRS